MISYSTQTTLLIVSRVTSDFPTIDLTDLLVTPSKSKHSHDSQPTQGASSRKSANTKVEEKNVNIFSWGRMNNKGDNSGTRVELSNLTGPSRHENSVSDSNNFKSLYSWYQYLKRTGKLEKCLIMITNHK